jgi:hypothetical protein
MRAMAVALFKKIDLDGNGKITPQEWQAFNTQPPPQQARPTPSPAPAPAPVAPGPRPGPKPAPAPTPGGLQPGVPLR